jgi:hypothetical protein
MKRLLAILTFGVMCAAYGDDVKINNYFIKTDEGKDVTNNIAGYEQALATGYFLITTNEETEIKQKLGSYENGMIDISNLCDEAGEEATRELIGYYLIHTNEISSKAKLPVARAYSCYFVFPISIRLINEYLNVYPNDWRGWRGLASSYMALHSWDQAIFPLTNAISLGDKGSFMALGFASILADKIDILKPYVPQMMAYKQAKNTPTQDRLSVTSVLLMYSFKTNQKDVFLEALQGVSMHEILGDVKLRQNVTAGCELFHGDDIDKNHQQMEKAEQKNSQAGSPH